MTTNDDPDAGSLRDPIRQANSNASTAVTTIDFNLGSGGLQIQSGNFDRAKGEGG